MIKYFILILITPMLALADKPYVVLSDNLTDPFIKSFVELNKVYLVGFGGGMMCDVDNVAMTFSGNHRLDIDAARQLYISGMNDLLNIYNSNCEIRPYLHNFPVTTNLFSFGLVFQESKNRFVSDQYIACVFCVGGIIFYKYYDKKNRKLCDLHKEKYEEAVKIIQSQSDIRLPLQEK